MLRILSPVVAVTFAACGPAVPQMPASPSSALSVAAIRADSDRRFATLLEGAANTQIFAQYAADGPARWGGNFTRRMNFSGIAWDDPRTATLVSPLHVVMAAHYQRPVGSVLSFHDRGGKLHRRTLTAAIPLSGIADVCVGRLDSPLPASVPAYRLLPPGAAAEELTGCLVVVTDRLRTARIHEIAHLRGKGVMFRRPAPDRIPPHLAVNLTKGDSGNPSFLLVGGELVLLETHTSGGPGAGPFYSAPEIFNAINAAMTQLGGGHQLAVVPIRGGG